MTVKITQLWTYPIKSCGGISLDRAEVGSRGFTLDRRFMVVDADGRFISQRSHAALARTRVALNDDQLVVSAADLDPIALPTTGSSGPQLEVDIWDDRCTAVDQGEDPARWFTLLLGVSCRLVFMPDTTIRRVDPAFARKTDSVGFSDGYPILLISQASLDDLNQRLETPVTMNRFRPNIVVSGCDAFDEDRWFSLQTGSLTLFPVKPCARCVVVTTDQITGERSREPLQALARYRSTEGKVMFGQNLIHDGAGWMSVGDRLTVNREKTPEQ